ncbi:hypothetical protein LINGRAHAP2_LOCUS4999, partial [Linum grandiflorum]
PSSATLPSACRRCRLAVPPQPAALPLPSLPLPPFLLFRSQMSSRKRPKTGGASSSTPSAPTRSKPLH